jgi:hypothetical protein
MMTSNRLTQAGDNAKRRLAWPIAESLPPAVGSPSVPYRSGRIVKPGG